MAKRYLRFDGVRKRCNHERKNWDLCACPWFFAVTHNGKRHRGKIPGATNEREARIAYKLIVARVENGQPPIEQAAVSETGGLTVAQLGEEWLGQPRKRKASVIDGYGEHLRVHINPVLGDRLVTAVTHDDCEALVRGLKRQRGEAPLSSSTKQRIAVTLQALFSFAVKPPKRLRPDNPAAGLPGIVEDPDAESPDDDVIDPQDHTKYFPADEAAHVLRIAEQKFPEWYLFVRVGMRCGLRMGELAGLRYEHINWRAGYLNVQAAFVKGRHTTTKNRHKRTVSLARELRALLRLRWREHRDSKRLVFASSTGKPIDIGNFRNRAWRDILEAAELDYRKPHAMRHTHTSLLLHVGESPAKVAEEAGRSLQETMRVYAHFLPAPARAGVEMVEDMAKDTVSFRRGNSGSERPRTATKRTRIKRIA